MSGTEEHPRDTGHMQTVAATRQTEEHRAYLNHAADCRQCGLYCAEGNRLWDEHQATGETHTL